MYENLKELGFYDSLFSFSSSNCNYGSDCIVSFRFYTFIFTHASLRICRQVLENNIYLYHNFALS